MRAVYGEYDRVNIDSHFVSESLFTRRNKLVTNFSKKKDSIYSNELNRISHLNAIMSYTIKYFCSSKRSYELVTDGDATETVAKKVEFLQVSVQG